MLGYPPEQPRDDILKGYYDAIADKLSEQNVNGNFAAMPQAVNPEDPVSPARVFLINEFGEMKGFELFRARLFAITEDYNEGRKGRHAKGVRTIICTLTTFTFILSDILRRNNRNYCNAPWHEISPSPKADDRIFRLTESG